MIHKNVAHSQNNDTLVLFFLIMATALVFLAYNFFYKHDYAKNTETNQTEFSSLAAESVVLTKKSIIVQDNNSNQAQQF